MREISADAWDIECDVLCITTNRTLKSGSSLNIRPYLNVMGGGIAGEAARRDRSLPRRYAELIDEFGHHVYLMMLKDSRDSQDTQNRPVLMFPTKQEVWEGSDLDTISTSVQETILLADIYGWKTIALPRPGAGLGGLDWKSQVKPYLLSMGLDDRFLIISYPGEV